MKRDPLHALSSVCRLAEMREQEALRRLAAERQQLAQSHQRQNELRGYVHDYAKQKPAHAATLMENHSRFLKRLQEAEAFQTGVVGQAQDRCESEMARWRDRARDQKLYNRLLENRRRAQRTVAERQTQRALDEWSARQSAQSSAAGARDDD